jgi:hypothetical protein
MIFHNYGVCFSQWYSMVRKPLVAESDLRRLHEDLPNILNLVKQGFPRRSVVDVDPGSDVPAEPDEAWCFPKFHIFQHLIPDNFLTFGQLDNTSAEAFETAHKYHVKDSWKGTNRQGQASTTIMESFSTIMETTSISMEIYCSRDIFLFHNYGKLSHNYGHYSP